MRTVIGEAVVRVVSTGLCGLDLDGYHGRRPMIPYPAIMGHECSLAIEALGPGVEGSAAGDAVVVEPFLICGKCPACLQGRYNLYKDILIIGYQVPGSLPGYLRGGVRSTAGER